MLINVIIKLDPQSKIMKVKFTFLTGDLDWAKHGGIWISQKFNNSGTDYWLVRQIRNWEGWDQDWEKYTVTLSIVCPGKCPEETRNKAIQRYSDDDLSWENMSDEEKVESLYSYGCYTKEEEWSGNNYSVLFQKCQQFANASVEGDTMSPPVDFSKLPENLLVVIRKDRYGHLEGKPKSDRHNHNLRATNIGRATSFYIQKAYINQFLDEYITPAKRNKLEEGEAVSVGLPLPFFLNYLPAPTYEYSVYIEAQALKRPETLPTLFTEINGIPIYHVHRDGYGEDKELEFWYSTAQYPEELHEEYSFRVDKLDPECRVKRIGDEQAIDAWNRFQERCKQVIAQALRDGKLKLAPSPDAAVLGGNRQPEPGSAVLGGKHRKN